MENLNIRLKEFRKSKKLTQKEIAKIVGLSTTGYFYYEQSNVEPNISLLIKLSDYYNVTLDALVGRDFEDTSDLPPMSTDQTVAVKMLLKLNQNNFVEAYSFVAGLLVNQQ